MIRKILWGIPSFLVSAIYIALGVFIGFNAKTSLMFGILFIACGVLGVGLLFYSPTTPNLRKVLLWTIGLGYGVLAFLASLDNGTITTLRVVLNVLRYRCGRYFCSLYSEDSTQRRLTSCWS